MINHAATIPGCPKSTKLAGAMFSYVFMYFTSKNSWRCLTWGVTLLLMWHALQIRALGWIKVVQGGCGLMIAFSSVKATLPIRNERDLEVIVWWLERINIDLSIYINRNVCCKENCSNLSTCDLINQPTKQSEDWNPGWRRPFAVLWALKHLNDSTSESSPMVRMKNYYVVWIQACHMHVWSLKHMIYWFFRVSWFFH